MHRLSIVRSTPVCAMQGLGTESNGCAVIIWPRASTLVFAMLCALAFAAPEARARKSATAGVENDDFWKQMQVAIHLLRIQDEIKTSL